MTAKARKPSRRYSREQGQENRSRHQLCERLDEVGWISSPVETDMGEDLLVRIYDDGASTGLSFYVQLKSTADSGTLKRKRTSRIAYELEVKDLLHWEVSATLVVLVVWDVEKRTGWWRPIPEIVRELDRTAKGWRKQKTVAAGVPLANGTNEAGMKRLRWIVADHSLPLVPKPTPMTFSMVFPHTEAGREALRTFERALDQGDAVTFERGFVPTIEYPVWHRRIYGADFVSRPIKLEFRPTPTTEAVAFRIEVDSPEGPATVPYLKLCAAKQGRKRLVLTNEQQQLPLVFTIDLSPDRVTFHFEQVRFGRTIHEALEAAVFMCAAGAPGSVLRIVELKGGHSLLSFPSGRVSVGYDLAAARRRRDLLEELSYIQQRVARFGSFSLEGLTEISAEDVFLIHRLFTIMREGRVEARKSPSFEVAADAQVPADQCGDRDIHMDIEGARVSLLGLEVPLGNIRVTILDSQRFLKESLRARAEAAAAGKPVHVHLDDMPVLEEYFDWLPGNLPWFAMYEALDHLSDASRLRDGYLTRADARAAGASDPVFDALLSEHKIERIASDVFRLTHFARSDHEELVTLWLQTDRQGVLSHDTALLLHELSDINPRRRHITVPPGWAPGDRKLDSNVVLHYGHVAEDEKRWLGPVPYTAPLRTLRDCIASHLSPDLIDQAIADGLRRGMFTEAELPPDLRRGAA
jgi:hypothetical protein